MKDNEDIAKDMEDATQAASLLDLPSVTDWCSTGSTVLDLAIANHIPGGIPVGRIVQIYGAASTAKSVVATTILGYALRSGKQAFLADTEHTFDPTFARYYGLDCHNENFFYGYKYSEKKLPNEQPETLEELFDVYLDGIFKLRSKKPKVVVIDSLTVLPAQIELEKAMDKQGFGAYRAKQIGLGLRKVMASLAAKNVTLFIVDQTRDSLDPFGKSEIVPGGRSLEFQTSVRIGMKHDKPVLNSKDKEVGVWVKFKIDKNKVAPPFRSGHFKIMFDYGLDDVSSMLSWLAEVQGEKKDAYSLTVMIGLPLVEQGENVRLAVPTDGSAITVPLVSKRLMDWVSYIEKYNLELDLRNYVEKIWFEVYKTEVRKPRVW